jgi:hypothetical protein
MLGLNYLASLFFEPECRDGRFLMNFAQTTVPHIPVDRNPGMWICFEVSQKVNFYIHHTVCVVLGFCTVLLSAVCDKESGFNDGIF